MNPYTEIYTHIIRSARYQKNILYGKPRRGHAEGTVAAHIDELVNNLVTLNEALGFSDDDYWKLMLLIHVHDSFKAEAKRNSPILDPQSHASLAKNFLSLYNIRDPDLLQMVQYHDIAYAVYRKFKDNGKLDEEKLDKTLALIQNKDLFIIFCIIDACTKGKGREMINWFVDYAEKKYSLKHANKTLIALLPQPNTAEGEW